VSLPFLFRNGLRVQIHGRTDVGVPQELLLNLDVLTVRAKHRRECPPELGKSQPIRASNPQIGDLMFWQCTKPGHGCANAGDWGHVAIVIGVQPAQGDVTAIFAQMGNSGAPTRLCLKDGFDTIRTITRRKRAPLLLYA